MFSTLKAKAMFFILMLFMLNAMPPILACGPCTQPHPPSRPPHHHGPPKHPPHHGGGGHSKPPPYSPPVVVPPIIINPPVQPPPVVYPPPVVLPPPVIYPPPTSPPHLQPPRHAPRSRPTCPIDALKLGLCLDVLGGLVHVGIGNPIENVCCPVIQGLLDLEAAICLCTVIRLRLLNLNIFIPLALQVLITCGKTPPPGFACPPL